MLKTKLNNTDADLGTKVKTESHYEESIKAMRYLLQKNVYKLIEIKEGINQIDEIEPPKMKTERISTKNFLPLKLLMSNVKPIEADLFKKESEIFKQVIEENVIIKNAKDFEEKCDKIRNRNK